METVPKQGNSLGAVFDIDRGGATASYVTLPVIGDAAAATVPAVGAHGGGSGATPTGGGTLGVTAVGAQTPNTAAVPSGAGGAGAAAMLLAFAGARRRRQRMASCCRGRGGPRPR